jgi:hypothetical protein
MCITFRRVRKIAKSDYAILHICLSVSVRPSVRMEQFSTTRRTFVKFTISVFRKSFEQIKFHLKSDKNNGHLT